MAYPPSAETIGASCAVDILNALIHAAGRSGCGGKSPAELLSGKTHSYWLELLGFEMFKRAA
jgi:hypothetical protein